MTLEVYGNTQECSDFALNQNGLTVDKIIITKDEFMKKLANPQTIEQLLQYINGCESIEEVNTFFQSHEYGEFLKTPLNGDHVRSIAQKIQEFFSSFDSIELKNYSFMSTMNTETYNIAIRTATNCVYSLYNVDKNALQSAFEEVFTKYFNSSVTRLSMKELQFQIEITRFEDVKKHFYLYKQGSKLLLFSQVGFPQEIDGCAYHVYGEQYSSYQTTLFYNKAQQEVAYTKQGSKLGYEQISLKGKVLDEQELTAIHQITNSLNDVSVEGYINSKGKVQLTHIQIFNLPIEPNQEHSFQLYTSSQTRSNISLYPFHEVQSSTQHSKFMLLRNNAEFKSALSSQTFRNVQGVVFTFSLFSPHLLSLCWHLDIDCIITKHQYSKMDVAEFNPETLEIISHAQEQEETQTSNPFSKILPQKSQEDIDTSNNLRAAQEELNQKARQQSDQLREERRAQQQSNYHSTVPSQSNQYTTSSSQFTHSGREKKTALQMMADEVLKAQEQQSQSLPQSQQQVPSESQSSYESTASMHGSEIHQQGTLVTHTNNQDLNNVVSNQHINHQNSSASQMFPEPMQMDVVATHSSQDGGGSQASSEREKILAVLSNRLNQLKEEQKQLEEMYHQLQE
ncbi:MAG: hypothetical protein ACLFPL_04630 [Candidatus Nanoarchaeia archaeon]